MSNYTPKAEEIPETVMTPVQGVEIWMVSWSARYDQWQTDTKRVAKAFLNKPDALKFVHALEDAQKLLQYTEDLNITVTKQE